MTLSRICLAVLSFAFAVASAGLVAAQEWPAKPVRVIVPYGVGGVTDTMARLTADRLTRVFGQPFVVENRPGAGGAIGTEYVIRAPNDGYTLLFIGGAQFSVVPLIQKVAYDPVKDLAPVSIIGFNGMVLAVNNESPFDTLKDLIDFARANPGKIDYSTAGPATNNHLSAAALAGREKLQMVHVPFGSGPAALTALLSKSVWMHFGNSSDLIQPVLAGKVKALGVSTRERMPQLPSVPTIAETIPDFELLGWNGYFAPAGTSPEIVNRIAATLSAATKDPEIKDRLYALGIDATGNMPKEIDEIIKKDIPFFAGIVDTAGLRRN